MRANILSLFSMISLGFILFSCSKGGNTPGGGTPTPPPQLSMNKTSIAADGWETVTFTAKDQGNNDITSSCQFYVGNVQLGSNTCGHVIAETNQNTKPARIRRSLHRSREESSACFG